MLDFLWVHSTWDRVIIALLFLSTLANVYLVGKDREPTTSTSAVIVLIINAILIVGLTMTMGQ